MFDDLEDELLSAYIDGELTAEEETRVERLLAAEPRARQLVEELRALSSTLQSLPAYALGEDLSGRVLRRAEREMLAEPARPLPRFHQVDPPRRRERTVWRRVLRPRNFVWSAAAIAVAVLIMVWERPPERRPGELAQRPAEGALGQLAGEPVIEAMEEPGPETISPEEPGDGRAEPVPALPADQPAKMVPPPPVETLADGPAPRSPDAVAKPQPGRTPPPAGQRAVRSLVVHCDVSGEEVGRKALAEVLAGEKIAWHQASDAKSGKKVVEIEVTAGQIPGLLAALRSKPEAFLGVRLGQTAGTAAPRAPAGARAVLTPSGRKSKAVPGAGAGCLTGSGPVAAGAARGKATLRLEGTFQNGQGVAEIKVPVKIKVGVSAGKKKSSKQKAGPGPEKADAADRPVRVQQPKYRLRFILRGVESGSETAAKPSADSAPSDDSPNASDAP